MIPAYPDTKVHTALQELLQGTRSYYTSLYTI